MGQRSGKFWGHPTLQTLQGLQTEWVPKGPPACLGWPTPHGWCPETHYLGKVKVSQHRVLCACGQRHGQPQQGREHSALHVWAGGHRGPAPQSHRSYGLRVSPWAYMSLRGRWGGAQAGLTEQVRQRVADQLAATHPGDRPARGRSTQWVPRVSSCPFVCSATVAAGPQAPGRKAALGSQNACPRGWRAVPGLQDEETGEEGRDSEHALTPGLSHPLESTLGIRAG